MAESHYTRQELFILRNHIPVDSLIKKLEISSKMIEGYFRFCCPVCCGFNTGVNLKTNLARCFNCRKNYNTIDFVILVRGLTFIQSVEFLKRFQGHKDETTIPYCPSNQRTASTPVSIGEVLKALKPGNNSNGATSKIQKINGIVPVDDINERLRQLEKKVGHLTQKIKQIEKNS